MLLHAVRDQNIFTQGDIFDFSLLFMYFTQSCFICRPSDSTVSEDARIVPRTVATLAIDSQTF